MIVTVHHPGTRYECPLCGTSFLYETKEHKGKKVWTIRHCLALECKYSGKEFLAPVETVTLEEYNP